MLEQFPYWLLAIVFTGLLAINVPVSFAVGLSTLACLIASLVSFEQQSLWLAAQQSLELIATNMADGQNKFSLLAIPFFILSGFLMERGGSARALVDFANVLVGWVPGGLAFVNILACLFFGAASGSATATAASVGSVMIPRMRKENYDNDFSTAVTMTAATTGLLIPPSNVMLVYAVPAGVSVAALFMAGFLPGFIIGGALMAVAAVVAHKQKFPRAPWAGWAEARRKTIPVVPELLLLIVILGGIISGEFTATEASVISVWYALIASLFFYRELGWKDLPAIFVKSAVTTAMVMFLIGVSSAMGYMFSYLEIPEKASAALLGLTDNVNTMLLLINLILLVVGCFIDMTPAVLIFTPIFLPIVTKLGVDPVHFGIIMIVNLCVGLCTPPVGSLLFVGCAVGDTTIGRLLRPMLPFLLALVAALLLITYLPADIIMWAPRYFLKEGG